MKLNLELSIPPSVNKCYANIKRYRHQGRILTEESRNWKLEAGYSAKTACRKQGWSMPEKGIKIILEIYAYWPDKRKHDMNNLHKLICDAFEGVVYPNDSSVLVRDMDYYLDRENPRVEIVCYEKD